MYGASNICHNDKDVPKEKQMHDIKEQNPLIYGDGVSHFTSRTPLKSERVWAVELMPYIYHEGCWEREKANSENKIRECFLTIKVSMTLHWHDISPQFFSLFGKTLGVRLGEMRTWVQYWKRTFEPVAHWDSFRKYSRVPWAINTLLDFLISGIRWGCV